MEVDEREQGAGGSGGGANASTVFRLLRKYWLLALLLTLAGLGAGVASVVLASPLYKVRALLEVQTINESFLKGSFEGGGGSDALDIQTKILLLTQGPFLRRVSERLQAETVPPPPVRSDLFSRLRRRLRPEIQDPIQVMKQGIETAFLRFSARPINGTRLIELTCDSTSPEVASQFLNTMASEFIEETLRSRSQNSQKTSEWLTSQIEETKVKLQEADQRLQQFVRQSGNVFVADDATLDDSKLKQLRGELSAIQADRIAKQARYEMFVKSPPETLPEVFNDSDLRTLQRQIAELRREKTGLEAKLTPDHPKVAKAEAQLAAMQSTLQSTLSSLISRAKGEYEAALRQESLLSAEYNRQLGRVGSEAGKSSEYNALKREVDTVRQMYQGLLMQANQTGVSGSAPVNPVRLVDPTTPPQEPFSPRPVQNISFGFVAGLALAGGIAALREKMDRSVRHPEATSEMLNIPQLGAIPSASAGGSWNLLERFGRRGPNSPRVTLRIGGTVANWAASSGVGSSVVSQWRDGPSFLAESFRATLASLINGVAPGEELKTIVVTSPGPAEGKTTVTANLAMALAETGRRVLLVDADLRRPRQHRIFGVPNDKALSALVLGDGPLDLSEIATPSGVPELTLLVNAPIHANRVASVLHSPRLKTLLGDLREQFDVILIDTSPVLHLADTRLLASWADGVVLVLRAGATDSESAREACRLLHADGRVLLGTILNDWSPSKDHIKRHYYYEAEAEIVDQEEQS